MLALLAVPAAAALLPMPMHLAAALVGVAGGTMLAGLRWHGWLGHARRLTHIQWLADGRWLLSDGTHQNIPATLSAGSRVGSRWVWLQWRGDGSARGPRRRSMLLLPGDLTALDLRRLGVRLRLEAVSRQPSRAQARCAGA